MKRLIKKSTGILIAGVITVTTSLSSVFAESYGSNIDTQIYTKDVAYIEDIKGRVEFNTKSDIKIENEKTGSVTTKKVNINKQEIKGGGETVISNKKKTSYKNIRSSAIIDLDVEINTPIIHGDDADVTIKSESETNFENIEADRIYKFNYYYNNPVRLPYWGKPLERCFVLKKEGLIWIVNC